MIKMIDYIGMVPEELCTIEIAKDRALEDIDYNNCNADTDDPIVYCCYPKNEERD